MKDITSGIIIYVFQYNIPNKNTKNNNTDDLTPININFLKIRIIPEKTTIASRAYTNHFITRKNRLP